MQCASVCGTCLRVMLWFRIYIAYRLSYLLDAINFYRCYHFIFVCMQVAQTKQIKLIYSSGWRLTIRHFCIHIFSFIFNALFLLFNTFFVSPFTFVLQFYLFLSVFNKSDTERWARMCVYNYDYCVYDFTSCKTHKHGHTKPHFSIIYTIYSNICWLISERINFQIIDMLWIKIWTKDRQSKCTH